MKQLICANEATYEVCNETVCFPVFEGYTLPVEIAKKLHTTYDANTGETITETRLFARMEQLTFIERKLVELGLM